MRDGGMPAIRKHVETTLGDSVERIASPRRWRWVDALPVNAIGKTSNADVAQLFEPHALRMPAAHCLDDGADRARYEIYVSPHLVVFSGHFTNLPVLPGVAQIEWAMLYGRAHFAIGGAFRRMEAIKFQRLYQPGRLLSLDMEWHADRAMLSFRFASSAGSHSSGRVFFAT